MRSDELSLRVGQLGSAGDEGATRPCPPRGGRARRTAIDPLAHNDTRCGAERSATTEELLLELADRIRDGEPLGVQGLAITALSHQRPLQPAVPIRM